MSDGFQLREVFNPTGVDQLAENIRQVWPAFEARAFRDSINPHLAPLNFGARNNLIRDQLAVHLPDNFPTAAQILIDALGPELTDCELTGFDGFMVMPQCDFVALRGLNHFEISMTALYEMTKRFTAEGAIRPFLQKYTDETLQRLEMWAEDKNCYVRRLVSEGSRPRLPLAPRLPQFIKDPSPVLRLLNKLKTDPVLMVRRSVANNLNDIAKDNPEAVVATLGAWQAIEDERTQWLIRHAARTLIKQGNAGALELLGYSPRAALRVHHLAIGQPVVQVGEVLEFTFEIESESKEPQALMIDYVIHHRKANGKLTPKVFKLAKKQLQPGQRLTLTKKHSFKPINTRVYYAGQHRLAIQINGTIYAEASFELVT